MTDVTGTQDRGVRESRLSEAFVLLADTLVDEFDVVDFLHELTRFCVRILGAVEAGVMLVDETGTLRVVAASHERTHLLELFQLQNHDGPCLECFRDRRPVISPDLEQHVDRWPVFVPAALDAGIRSVTAVPMRLRGQTLGALNIFLDRAGALDERDQRATQALADIATIGLLHERTLRESQEVVDQLQHALHSRVAIEQAKGLLAERAGIDVADAFERLRDHARSHNRRLSEVAGDLLAGRLDSRALDHGIGGRAADPARSTTI